MDSKQKPLQPSKPTTSRPAATPSSASVSDIRPANTTSTVKPTNNTSANTTRSASPSEPRPGAYTDPLVRPTVELPTRPSYQSKDIGTKTAVQIDPFVKVEESFGSRLRKFFHLKPKGNKTENSPKGQNPSQPQRLKPNTLTKEQKTPNPSQSQATSTNSAQNSKDVVKITTPGASTTPTQSPLKKTSTSQTPSKAPTTPDANKASTSEKPARSGLAKLKSTLKSLLHFLFAGFHKFLTIPLTLIILAETVIIILFLTGVFNSPLTQSNSLASTDSNTQLIDFLNEANRIYSDIDNDKSIEDTVDYVNSTIAALEEGGEWDRAAATRRQAYVFYTAREQWRRAGDVAANINYSTINDQDAYNISVLASQAYAKAGDTELSQYYAALANQYADITGDPKLNLIATEEDTLTEVENQ